jgi:hypothetical protein
MGLPTEAIIGICVIGGLAAVVIGKTLSANSNKPTEPVERDQTINNEHNISGGRSRRNRQRKNKSRRR